MTDSKDNVQPDFAGRTARHPYTPPTLTAYGAVAHLTASGNGSISDGGNNSEGADIEAVEVGALSGDFGSTFP